ncbi:hypothetical protein Tco_0089484 [Tanacetum coccineum]
MKILEIVEQRIEKVGKLLNQAKQIMDITKGKDKMVIEREVIIIESDISCDHKPFQATSDESSDHNPFEATFDESSDHNPFQSTFDESSDHNPFQATSDESSDHNPFEATFDDTLKSSSEDTCQALQKQKKDTIPLEIVQWYDDLSLDEKRTVYKGRRGLSFRNAAITKPEKPKLRSKHLAPTTPRTGLTCTTLVVPKKATLRFGPCSCYNLATD